VKQYLEGNAEARRLTLVPADGRGEAAGFAAGEPFGCRQDRGAQAVRSQSRHRRHTIERILADKGYRGHNAPPDYKFRVFTSGQKRRMTPKIKRELRRRSAIEPVIGHLKSEHRMGRNYLWHRQGDATNAVQQAEVRGSSRTTTEAALKTQYDALVRTGEKIKKENPSLKLTPAAKDREEGRRVRRMIAALPRGREPSGLREPVPARNTKFAEARGRYEVRARGCDLRQLYSELPELLFPGAAFLSGKDSSTSSNSSAASPPLRQSTRR
jgi:hypothetical protein